MKRWIRPSRNGKRFVHSNMRLLPERVGNPINYKLTTKPMMPTLLNIKATKFLTQSLHLFENGRSTFRLRRRDRWRSILRGPEEEHFAQLPTTTAVSFQLTTLLHRSTARDKEGTLRISDVSIKKSLKLPRRGLLIKALSLSLSLGFLMTEVKFSEKLAPTRNSRSHPVGWNEC